MRSQTLPIVDESPPTTAVFRSLIRTFGLLKRVMEPHFTTVGISGPQWAILRTLREVEVAGEPEVRLSDLGARLLVRPPSVTGIVRRLTNTPSVRNGLLKPNGMPRIFERIGRFFDVSV